MKKNIQSLLIALAITLTSFGQSTDPIVLKIDGNGFNISEFNYIYTKNNKDISYKKNDLDAYMELFIDYKLKVKEAKRLGYDTIPRLVKELAQYRTQLSQPYMIDKAKNEALVVEAYDRTKNELRASHILIRVPETASPADTLKAYNEVIALRDRVVAGEDFSAVASGRGGSQDPSVKVNGGDLGYFTALQMVYPFEDAAFNTLIGDVSMPVRTKFGYHIIKAVDKRVAGGKIQTAHIMILSNDKMSEADNKKAEEKINEIYALLENGDKFDDIAMRFSDDQSSKAKGGLLPEFGASTKQRMVPEFEETAFAIANDGEYAKPILTSYGWHIIKRIKVTPIPSYDEMYRELKLKVERDVRAQTTKNAFINTLKKEYNCSENKDVLVGFDKTIDISIMQGKWKKMIPFNNQEKVLFSFAKTSVTLNDFANYLLDNQRREKPTSMESYIENKYKTFVTSEVTKYEDSQLERKYPEFKTLMQEYQDGILIFEIMQNEIWNKASKDTVGLANYYEAHKSDFFFPTRYMGTLYTCKDKSVAKQTRKLIKEGVLSPEDIAVKINESSALNLKTKTSTFNSETTSEFKKKNLLKSSEKAKFRKFKAGKSAYFKYNGAYCIMDTKEVLEPSEREFKQAKGLVTAAYQNELQEKWLSELRSKSKVEIVETILYSAKKYK
jgi:peptidyl-prolyl cis-trans isomerase SurA